MTTQQEKAAQFHASHQKGNPVILFNIWDAGSAVAVAKAGAHALATGSAPVAMANGYKDGEQMPLSLALDNFERIVSSVDLPVTMDIEGGYGAEPEIVSKSISLAIAAGAIGFNFEDQIVGTDNLYDISVQSTRISAVRGAIDKSGIPAYLNARTDIFLKAPRDTHTSSMIDQAVERARIYADAGADGFFAPGLADEALIDSLCSQVSIPVNIIALPGVPENSRLRDIGVARISYGPVPYRQMIKQLEIAASEALGSVANS